MRATALAAAICVGALLVPTAASARGKTTTHQEQLALLDGDAGLVLSVAIPQLQRLHALVSASFPHAKSSIDLGTLGMMAILGFHPFNTRAWETSGFDVESHLLIQAAAIDYARARASDRDRSLTFWRTRIVLKSRDSKRAAQTLSNMRWRDKTRLDAGEDATLQELLGVRPGQLRSARRKLKRAGVFLVARPAPLQSLLFASQRGDLFVIDLLKPYGKAEFSWEWRKHAPRLLQTLRRRPDELYTFTPGASVLESEGLGAWLRPSRAADAMAAAEREEPGKGTRGPHCEGFRWLAAGGSFDTVSASAHIGEQEAEVQLAWHLPVGSDLPGLLGTAPVPLLRPEDARLQATLYLSQLGALRGRKRAPVAAAWDRLWRSTRRCGRASKVFAIAVAWPEIAGLFLDEISALDPSARRLLDGLGGLAFSMLPGAGNQLIGEAWVRSPGDAVARQWLETLFGGERKNDNLYRWGHGKIRPYARVRDGGSVIGAGFRDRSRVPALGDISRQPREPTGLFELRAQTGALEVLAKDLPFVRMLSRWQTASASLALEERTLRFHLRFDQR